MKLKTLLNTSPIVKRFETWCKTFLSQVTFTTIQPKLIKFIEKYPIENLMENRISSFQRALQFGRLKNIALKVAEFGFFQIPIIVDESYKIIDGGHRLVVAWIFGLKHVPVIVYQFRSVKEKSHAFSVLNTPEGGPIAIMERIEARRIANYSYEIMIDTLIARDTGCLFYDKVAYKGHTGKDRITMVSFLKMFNWIGAGVRIKWQNGEVDKFLQTTCKNMMKNGEYNNIRDRMNNFASWMYGWAGTKRSTTPTLYNDRILYGMLEFYLMMLEQRSGNELKKTLKASVKKFTGYDLKSLLSYDINHVSGQIISDYNHGKHGENRMQPIVFEDRFVPRVWTKK